MKTKQTRPNRHQVLGAAAAGFQIYILKDILWELVIESRQHKGPIDVMPYVERIRQMFK